MSLTFGDLAQSFALKSHLSRLKSETFRLSNELAGGQKTDVAAALGGDTTALASIERARGLASGYLTAARDEALRTDGRQLALGQVQDRVEEVRASIVADLLGGSPEALGRSAGLARSAFGQAVRALNADVGGRSLFSGMAANGPALASADTILAALQASVAGAVTPAEIRARITGWFDDPAGFQSVAYLGGPPAPGTGIAPDGTMIQDRTALDPGIRKSLIGLAMATFADTSALSPAGADRAAFLREVAADLGAGTDALTGLRSDIGVDQSRIERSRVGLESERLAFELARSELISVDPARTATELEAVRSNLETVFAVTARLSRLRLSEFLR